MPDRRASLEQRVVRLAEAALAERSVVSPIDVLIGLGWLTPQAVDTWRQVGSTTWPSSGAGPPSGGCARARRRT